MSLRDIIVDTRVSTLTRRGRHQCGRLVLFIGEKQCYFDVSLKVGSGGVRTRKACMTGEAVRRSTNAPRPFLFGS